MDQWKHRIIKLNLIIRFLQTIGVFFMKKLILIEGLPGTGKTTIAKWLYNYLQELGENVTLLLEGDERIPCDFYEMAGIPKKDFEILCSSNDCISDALKEQALQTENYAYLRMDKCPEDIAKQIRRWDMGDEGNKMISVTDYIPCALERLNYWVCKNIVNSEITIIDSGYLQNPINELLFRKASENEVRSFISGISHTMEPLNPICIYMRRNDAEESIAFAKKVKGKEWAHRVENLLIESGCEDLFHRRFVLEQELLPLTTHLVCKVAGDDWMPVKKLIKDYFTK